MDTKKQRALFKVATFDGGGNIGAGTYGTYTVLAADAEEAIKRAQPLFGSEAERVREVEFVSHVDA